MSENTSIKLLGNKNRIFIALTDSQVYEYHI